MKFLWPHIRLKGPGDRDGSSVQGLLEKWSAAEQWKKLVLNRFIMIGLVFLVYMGFFDRYNLITQYRLSSQLQQLKKDAAYYQEQTIVVRQDLHDLTTNFQSLEKFAREKYYMKRDNEDIFVVVEK